MEGLIYRSLAIRRFLTPREMICNMHTVRRSAKFGRLVKVAKMLVSRSEYQGIVIPNERYQIMIDEFEAKHPPVDLEKFELDLEDEFNYWDSARP